MDVHVIRDVDGCAGVLGLEPLVEDLILILLEDLVLGLKLGDGCERIDNVILQMEPGLTLRLSLRRRHVVVVPS